MTRRYLIDYSELRQNNFDFLRFVLASAVLFSHSFPALNGAYGQAGSFGARFAPYFGYTAVDMFFIISGFLVTNSWVRSPHLVDYLKKRILRIYPAFILLSILSALVEGPLGAVNVRAYWHAFPKFGFVSNMLVLAGPDISPIFAKAPLAGVVNASAWTLRYEFGCYLLVAMLGLLAIYRKRAIVLGVFAASCVLCAVQTSGLATIAHSHVYRIIGDPVQWIRLIACFLAGMTAYLYRDRIVYSPRLALGLAIALVALVIVKPQYAQAVSPLAGAYVLMFLAFTPSIKFHNWAKHGDISYGIYLYAFPIQQLILLFMRPHLTVALLTLIAYPLTIIAAALSWKLVEQPALRLKGLVQAPQMHPPIVRPNAAAQ
jgi:peptidoglycan/LPS O-acetylase OafA/YrhL